MKDEKKKDSEEGSSAEDSLNDKKEALKEQ